MAKVLEYHTNSSQYPQRHREVHHNHDNCPNGKDIKSWHWQPGTGGKPRCNECSRMG
jgi:hypothetical protein